MLRYFFFVIATPEIIVESVQQTTSVNVNQVLTCVYVFVFPLKREKQKPERKFFFLFGHVVITLTSSPYIQCGDI